MVPSETFYGARILIVDDDERVAAAMTRVLQGAGYSDVYAVHDSTAALERVEELRPSLLLLDLHMPGVDGFEVLGSLRARNGESDILPVMVLTADDSQETRERAWSLGATDFVTKPFEPANVLPRILSLLRTHTIHRTLSDHAELLERRVRDRTEELELAHAEVLVRLALAAEYRDDVTGEHTWRVGRMSSLLADRLGMPADRHKLIERAARLHDVGKIGIRDAVLLKQGRLTPAEFDVMKTHTTIGAKLLSKGTSEVLQLAERVARSHHERWNGEGYPDGLIREAIPREGRIVAVADVFDALTHTRSYKETWSAEAAIEEICRQRGRQFDPEVVDAFMILADEDELFDVGLPGDAKFKSILPDAPAYEPE